MFKYTKSAASDSFDFIKRLIYAFQIAIQLVYVLYIAYKLTTNSGNLIGNIILTVLSAFNILFQIVTTKEFYTKRQRSQKAVVKWIVKISKYAVNLYIIITAAISLISGTVENENATMLITILMIFGVLTSAVFDVILLLIDKQVELIKSAVMYDIEIFKAHHDIATMAIKKVGLDLEKEFPKLDDKKVIKRIKDANHRQEQKNMRKRDFKKQQRAD